MSKAASDELLSTDWYAILQVRQDASDEVIAKAARKMGLKCHPDKTDDPKDHELFLLVQKAKETLLDASKRSEYDKHINAVIARKLYESEREKGMDSRRKRMRDELESKLSAAQQGGRAAGIATSSSSGHANSNDKSSSSSINFNNKNKMADENISFMEREREREYTNARKVESEEAAPEDGRCQVKVKWRRNKVSVSHSDDSLYQLFKIYGDIEDVVLTGDMGNAAMLTFKAKSAAVKACEAYSSSADYKLTLQDGSNKKKATASMFTHVYTDNKAFNPVYAASSASQEDEIAEAIRRSMKRDALVREMETAERLSGFGLGLSTSHASSARSGDGRLGLGALSMSASAPPQELSEELHSDFRALALKYSRDGDFDFSWEHVAQMEARVLGAV